MDQMVASDLEALGLDVARQIAGADAVEQVSVTTDQDSDDRPVYRFSFLIDPDRSQARMGLVRIRLRQTLRDALVARGDEHSPVIQFLERAD
jgi:hypothetical protein